MPLDDGVVDFDIARLGEVLPELVNNFISANDRSLQLPVDMTVSSITTELAENPAVSTGLSQRASGQLLRRGIFGFLLGSFCVVFGLHVCFAIFVGHLAFLLGRRIGDFLDALFALVIGLD